MLLVLSPPKAIAMLQCYNIAALPKGHGRIETGLKRALLSSTPPLAAYRSATRVDVFSPSSPSGAAVSLSFFVAFCVAHPSQCLLVLSVDYFTCIFNPLPLVAVSQNMCRLSKQAGGHEAERVAVYAQSSLSLSLSSRAYAGWVVH